MPNKLAKPPGVPRRFLLCAAAFILSVCTACGAAKPHKYNAQFDGLFDTHAEIVGYAASEKEFTKYSQLIYDEMTEYSKLFDIYNTYVGMNNLKTINDSAGVAPVKVDEKIIKFLKSCAAGYPNTYKTVNIAMGPVLSIWHDFREAGVADPEGASLPNMADLRAAAQNTDIGNMIIDEAGGTVFLKNKGMSLDVGATAKGYAAGIVVNDAKAIGMTSALVDMGGNVVGVGKPLDGTRDRWGVGIQDPKQAVAGTANIMDTVYVNDMSVVTSGDYERYYMVKGVRYNHIIDPATLMPARKYASVTIVCGDSGLADELSTALFILDEDKGRELLKQNNADAIWVYLDGKISYTDGYKAISKTYGGYSAVDPRRLIN